MAPPPPHPLHGGSSTTTSSNPQTLQFLSNVLSQRGPSSLPYSEDVKWLIRQHLVSLTDCYPCLQPKTATFTHNDGRTVNLLQADGTVPMSYQGVTYNIPVVLWLIESYPKSPPCVFLNPTRDMIIKRPHPYVTPNGLVNVPYLRNWVYPSSNLVDLVRDLSHCFGRDPPLYSQQPPHRKPQPDSASGGGPITPGAGGRVFPPSPYSGRITPPQWQSPQRPGASASASATTDDPTEVYRRNAINRLVERVHEDVGALRKTREAEMEGLFSAQATLRQREEQLNTGLKEMLDEKEGLEQQLQLVLTNADVLEAWLKENEDKKVSSKLGTDVDQAFQPCDALSKQMIESSASDLAIEDVIYSLDKAVQDGVLPFDHYLKNVRSLSREQFFHRATSVKVRAAQMQAHVATMASRTSQYTI